MFELNFVDFQAWTVTRQICKDDWMNWLRNLSVELLKESPSLALKACGGLAKTYTPLARYASNTLITWDLRF